MSDGTYEMTFTVCHEAWYTERNRPQELMITKAHRGGGCKWEFGVRANPDINAIRAEVFEDAFAAFAEVPDFFAGLAELGKDATIGDVVALCAALGYTDTTPREHPDGVKSDPLPSGRHAVIWAYTPKDGRRLLSRYDGDRRDQWVCDDPGLRTSFRSVDLSNITVVFEGVQP